MRWRDYLDIGLAPDKATFRRRMIEFAHWMDFPIVGVVLLTEGRSGKLDTKYIGNRPPDFAAGNDLQLLKMDPVVAQLRRSADPFVYNQKYYVDAGVPVMWEIAAPYGYRTGISAALAISSNQRLMVGLDRERDLPTDQRKIDARLKDLARFAELAASGAQRFAAPSYRPSAATMLSGNEREVLLHVLDGKSNWVIAQVMSISENTVKFHLKSVFRKLDTSSRVVAATRAMVQGLL